jgi:hypothetical protein
MITFGESITRTPFCNAAYQGWKEITGKEIILDGKQEHEFWDALQKNAETHRYPETRLGLFLRAGRCGFHNFLDLTGEEIGLRTTQFRMHPVQKRIEIGFERLTKICQQSGFKYFSSTMTSGFCIDYGELLLESQRGYLTGFFQEFLEWVSQGRVYPLIQQEIKGFCFASEPLNQ